MQTKEYIPAIGRNTGEDKLVAHLYEGPFDALGYPMCARGWNRNDGAAYSIFRNNVGSAGVCKVCQKRANKGLSGVPENQVDLKSKAVQGWNLKRLWSFCCRSGESG